MDEHWALNNKNSLLHSSNVTKEELVVAPSQVEAEYTVMLAVDPPTTTKFKMGPKF